MSLQFTLDGKITHLPINENVENVKKELEIFRKMIPFDSSLEKSIARIIKDNPCKNVVKIYEITNKYIDMEILDVYCFKRKDIPKIILDITEAINQLHSINIVYIDLRIDNIGYSHNDSCWKIFDFDSSGILGKYSTSEWLLNPAYDFKYMKYLKTVLDNGNLLYFDNMALDDFKKQIEIEIQN